MKTVEELNEFEDHLENGNLDKVGEILKTGVEWKCDVWPKFFTNLLKQSRRSHWVW